jgi:hypothetical protein
MKYLFFFALCLVPLVSLRPSPTDRAIVTDRGKDSEISWKIFQKHGVRITHQKDGYLTMERNDSSIRALMEIVRAFELKIEVARENLKHRKRGGNNLREKVYRRKRVVYRGEIRIETDPSPYLMVYDPQHPDAIRSGSRAQKMMINPRKKTIVIYIEFDRLEEQPDDLRCIFQ